MPIPSTGPVSLADVQAEFSGSNPIAINEYYEGAASGYVTSTNYTPANQIPESGTISLADFRGVSKLTSFIFNDTITASTEDGYSLRAKAITAGWNTTVPIIATITINSGVVLTGADWPTGPTRGRPGVRLQWTLWLGAAGLVFARRKARFAA